MLKKIAGVAAGAGLAMAATGCGVIPGMGPNPMEVIAGLADKTNEVESYRAEFAMSGELSGASGATAEVEYTATPEPTMKMSMEIDGVQNTVLMRGEEMIVNTADMGLNDMGPSDLGGAPVETPEWLRMDMGEMGVDAAHQDPLSEVEKLLAVEEAEAVGTEEVNGTETTRYTGSYSTDKALEQLGDQAAKDAASEIYGEIGVDTVDFDVWVDGDGMPRRVVSSLGDQVEAIVDFLEFNQPVDIEYPSSDQIGDMNDMF